MIILCRLILKNINMVDLDYIANRVSEETGYDIRTKSRERDSYAYSRFIYYKLCNDFKNKLGLSGMKIGKHINYDNACFIYGVRKFDEISDQKYFELQNNIYLKLKEELREKLSDNKYYITERLLMLKKNLSELDLERQRKLVNSFNKKVMRVAKHYESV